MDDPKTPEYTNGSKVISVYKFNREKLPSTEQSIQEVIEVEERTKEARNKLAKIYTISLEHINFLAKWN